MSDSVALSPAFDGLVDTSAVVERIATGFAFTEGPVWDYRNQRLIFCDFDGDAVHQWREGYGHSVFRQTANRTNGSTIDSQGRLVCCEASARRISRQRADGSFEVIADQLDGKRLNAPNDLVIGPDGAIYFTDTPYGLDRNADGNAVDRDLPAYGVYRIDPQSSSLRLLSQDFNPPNGIAVNSDGTKLFVDDTGHHNVSVFDLSPQGYASNRRDFANTIYGDVIARPDGMKLDALGNLYLAGNTELGLWVYSPDGTLLGFIGTPEPPANCAFGGDDWSMLYITARTSVYRIQLKVAGQPVGVYL